MKKILATLALLGTAWTATPALAADMDPIATAVHGWYAEVRLGTPLPPYAKHNVTGFGNNKYKPDNNILGVVAVGKHLNNGWRGEFEFSWATGSKGKYIGLPHRGSYDVFSFMLNGLYDFKTDSAFTPFIGAGLGVGVYSANNVGAVGGAFTVDDTKAAFQAVGIVGLDYALANGITLTGRYTAGLATGMTFSTTAAAITSRQSSRFIHNLTAGVRIDLN